MSPKRNTTSFKLEGSSLLAILLKDFPAAIKKDVVNSAVAAGAGVIRKRTRQNIKEKTLVETGNLLKSIKLKKRRDRNGAYYIYSDGKLAPHAHLQEFGTAPRVLKKPHFVLLNGQWVWVEYTGSVPATPFMRPALEENKSEVLIAIHKQLKKRMEKEAKKMSQKYGTMSKSYRKKLAT